MRTDATDKDFFPLRESAAVGLKAGGAFFSSPGVSGGQGRSPADVLGYAVVIAVGFVFGIVTLLVAL